MARLEWLLPPPVSWGRRWLGLVVFGGVSGLSLLGHWDLNTRFSQYKGSVPYSPVSFKADNQK